MIIDMHTHFVPSYFPDMSGRGGGNRWPTMDEISDTSSNVMISGKVFRAVTEQSWCAKRRLEDMDQEGIDKQVISPMPVLSSYWFESKDTLAFSDFIHGQLAELIQTSPDRFYGLGTVPLQDPELSASYIPRLKREFGLLGVQIGTNVNGRPIGDPFFNPFFEAAESEGVALFLHPLQPIGQDRVVGPPSLQPVVNFQLETGAGVTSLITGGVLEKYPNLRIAVSHGGGSFFSILPRLVHGWNVFENLQSTLSKSPMEYAAKLYYDSLVYDDLTLQHLVKTFGYKQLLVGSDYPFIIMDKSPGRIVERLDLPSDQKKEIFRNNSLKFLGVAE
jgi:aminocarboxymuconate-semialdehyde decarboxylase